MGIGATTTNFWYEYDPLGNRVEQAVNTKYAGSWNTTAYNYNLLNNELLNSTSGSVRTQFGYDGNGNQITKSVASTSWTYNWSVQGELLSVSNNSGVQGYYGYDGLGRRVEAKEGSSATFYAYTGTETLADEFPALPANDYVYAGGLRLAKVNGGQGTHPTVTYYHEDALGSTCLVTSTAKTIIFSDTYLPYGQDNSAVGAEIYKFTGKLVSATTGLYYYYHRWYDPSVGRFISPDPKQGRPSDPTSLNPYLYVEDCPSTKKDSAGELTEEVPVGGAVIWWSNGGVEVLNSGGSVFRELAIQALRGVHAIQIDYSKYTTYDARKITYSDGSVSLVPNNRDPISEIAEKALHGVRPIRVDNAVTTPQLSTNTYDERLFAFQECANNAQQFELAAVFFIVTASAASHVAVVFPPAELVTLTAYAIAGTEALAGAAYYAANCVPPTPP